MVPQTEQGLTHSLLTLSTNIDIQRQDKQLHAVNVFVLAAGFATGRKGKLSGDNVEDRDGRKRTVPYFKSH